MWRKVGCVILILVVLGLVALIVYKQSTGEGWKGISFGKKKDADEDKEPYFEAARRGDLKIVVEATGQTEPVTDIEVKSEATGKITAFSVKEGDIVKAGDEICKLDQTTQQLIVQQQEIAVQRAQLAYDQAKSAHSSGQRAQLESAVASAQAGVDSARDAHDKALAALSRIEELYAKGYVNQQELESSQQQAAAAKAQLDSAEASLANAKTQLENFTQSTDAASIKEAKLALQSAKVSLAEARKQLGDSVIVAPIPGVIMEKLLDVGDSVVSINSSFGGGNTIVKIADLSRIQIRTSIDEIDIGKIKTGQAATITVDAFSDREFPGQVTNVFPQGVASGQGLINFIALVEVDNAERLLLGNMTATVKIEAKTYNDVLLIPLAATRAGEEPDTTVVEVLKDGEDPYDEKAETEKDRKIKVGDTDYADIIVLDGLKEGEMVKVRGFAAGIQFD